MFSQKISEIKNCIACDSTNLLPLLNLGEQPLANSFKHHKEEHEEFFPLSTNYCSNCFHVQLTHKVHPDLLFKNYLYVSGTAKTQLEYFKWFAEMTIQYNTTAKKVLDIGCNDGSQLDEYKILNLETFGVDPAENLYSISSSKHNVICNYFNETTFSKDTHFDIISCQNAFAHNYDQIGFLKMVSSLMNNGSKLFITTSQANMIINGEFDTIYHEHLSFYNTKSMNELCKRAGLFLQDVLKHPIHGTSYIFVISKVPVGTQKIESIIKSEKILFQHDTYAKYVERCEKIRDEFKNKIKELKGEGYTIIGYGAPAKGNTLMNYANTGVDFIIDDNKLKQNMFTPGLSVPIYSSSILDNLEGKHICFIPLAWNFFDEIKSKIIQVRNKDTDKFLKYFPQVVIV